MVEDPPVGVGFADQHGRHHPTFVVDVETLVHAADRVVPHERGPIVAAMDVADAGDGDAEQLQLGREVHRPELRDPRRVEAADLGGEVLGRHPGHLVAGSHQAEGPSVEGCDLTDRQHVRVARAHPPVDGDPAALGDLQPAVTSQCVTGADSRGEHDQVDRERVVTVEAQRHRVIGRVLDGERASTQVDPDADRLDAGAQRPSAALVELDRHEPRSELDDVGLEPQVVQGVGGFESEQPAAHDDSRRHSGSGRRRPDRRQVVDGAVHVAPRPVAALHRGDERERARRQHEPVEGQRGARRGVHGSADAVDALDRIAEPAVDAVAVEEVGLDQRQVLRRRTREQRAQRHAVIGRPGLLAEDGDVERGGGTQLDQGGEQTVPDHPVSDDDEAHPVRRLHGAIEHGRSCRAVSRP